MWKDLVGYEGLYEVSDSGDLRSVERIIIRSDGRRRTIKQQEIKPYTTKNGRLCFNLKANRRSVKGLLVHRAVAITFLPNPENKPEVNHIDGNPKNNSVSNLEWVTKSENELHAYRTGLKYSSDLHKEKTSLANKNRRSLSPYKIASILGFAKTMTHPQIALITGISRSMVQHIVSGNRYGDVCQELRNAG